MKSAYFIITALIVALLSIFVMVTACGEEGDNRTVNFYDDDDDDDDDDDTGDDDDDADSRKVGGTVAGFPSSIKIPNIEVRLVNNQTGEDFTPPIISRTSVEGYFIADAPEGFDRVGVMVYGEYNGAYHKSYHFNVNVGSVDGEFYDASYYAVWLWALMQINPQENKGYAFGLVKWEEEAVGCAIISPDRSPGQKTKIGYFTDVFPLGQGSTNPKDGAFVAVNYTPGEYAFEAKVNDRLGISSVLPIFAGASTFYRISYTGSYNPTPEGCE